MSRRAWGAGGTLATIATAGGAAYFASLLRRGALEAASDAGPDNRGLVVRALDGDTVTLVRGTAARGDEEWTMPGVYGLEWQGGYAQVGPIVEASPAAVRRELRPRWETVPPEGAAARIDSFAYPWDPFEALGYAYADEFVPGDLGAFPAWVIGGDPTRWAIFVHGKGASRREAFRALPPVVARGFTALLATYRNDPGAPASPDGNYSYGASEWQDIAAAIEFARRNGARELVLFGYSMGGAIVLSYLRNTGHPDDVRALVLDSPMLDFHATIRFGCDQQRVPRAIAIPGVAGAGVRLRINWRALDYLRDAGRLHAPVLLFHGARDRRVPVATSDRLAAIRPDIVQYARSDVADHVRSWNVAPDAYEARLAAFLGALKRRRP